MESANSGVTKDAVVRQVVLTEGELLPWKGWWWKVHLNNDTRTVELVQQKETVASSKVVARAMRWRKTHPTAIVGLQPGSVSGLQVLPVALRSTEQAK